MQEERCPSVAHVLDRLDGGLARIRVPGGRLASWQLAAVAEAALRFASGPIEVTNRANLQLRGVRPGQEEALAAHLAGAGLSAGGPGDLHRNVLAGPMAGLDPTETADTTGVVAAVAAAMAAEAALDSLPPKCGVTVDGGGRWHLGGRTDDVVVTATGAGSYRLLAAGRDLADLGEGDVPAATVDALVAVSAAIAAGSERAVVTVPERPGGPVVTGPLGAGCQPEPGSRWVGAMPLLGRIDPGTAGAVAGLAERHAGGQVRLTPWRGVVLAGVADADAPAVLAGLESLGLVTDDRDPAAWVVACAGSSGCTSGLSDAQGDALAVAAARRDDAAGPFDVHVSGCPKRCARRSPASLTLVGAGDGRYDVWVADGAAPAGERLAAAGLGAGEALALAAAASPAPATPVAR